MSKGVKEYRTMQGVVKFWNEGGGYGFIERDDAGGRDVFCHVSKLMEGDALEAGERVEFELDAEHPKGPRALHVRRVEEEEGV